MDAGIETEHEVTPGLHRVIPALRTCPPMGLGEMSGVGPAAFGAATAGGDASPSTVLQPRSTGCNYGKKRAPWNKASDRTNAGYRHRGQSNPRSMTPRVPEPREVQAKPGTAAQRARSGVRWRADARQGAHAGAHSRTGARSTGTWSGVEERRPITNLSVIRPSASFPRRPNRDSRRDAWPRRTRSRGCRSYTRDAFWTVDISCHRPIQSDLKAIRSVVFRSRSSGEPQRPTAAQVGVNCPGPRTSRRASGGSG